MRQELADVREAYDMMAGLSKWQGEQLRELKGVLERAKRLLPRYTHTLPPEVRELRGPTRGCIELPINNLSMPPSWSDAIPLHEYRRQPLDVVVACLKRAGKLEHLDECLHTLVRFGEERELRYAISAQAVQSMPEEELAELLTHTVAHQLGSQMARGLKK